MEEKKETKQDRFTYDSDLGLSVISKEEKKKEESTKKDS